MSQYTPYDVTYSFRNFVLYHQRKKEPHLAKDFFRKAFDQNTPVDLLDYHYGEFLLEQGDIENAKVFFLKSAKKMEEEGISKLREFS